MASTPPTKPKFQLIEAARGVAAMLVVFHHIGSMLAEPRFYGVEPFAQHFRNFNVGVDFFFVLSGFIITWVHWRDMGRPETLRGYAAKRFFRILPPYWGLLFPLILGHALFPDPRDPLENDPLHILQSVFLIPSPEHPVLGVAWTLTFEIFFYALFLIVLLKGRDKMMLFWLWAVAIIVVQLSMGPVFPFSFLFSPFNLEFVMGMTAAALLRRYPRLPAPMFMMFAGAVLFVGFMWFAPHIQDVSLHGRLVFGIASALFVLGAVELERRRLVPVPRPMSFLGAASYSLYLIHPLAILVAAHMIRLALGRQLPIELAVFLMFAAALVAGGLYHLLVEKRLTMAATFLMQRGSARRAAGEA